METIITILLLVALACAVITVFTEGILRTYSHYNYRRKNPLATFMGGNKDTDSIENYIKLRNTCILVLFGSLAASGILAIFNTLFV